jgi:hypothetical protein
LNTLNKSHHLVEFVRQTFGEQFGAVLLAGYGEEAAFRELTLNLVDSQGGAGEGEWQLVISGNVPSGQDPLVLAALLKLLLLSGAPLTPTLEFNPEEVLSELGWPDTPPARAVIDGAVRKYLGLTYARRMRPPSGMLRGMYALLVGYERADEKHIGGGSETFTYNSVTFHPHFIERLNSSVITFAGIEFGELNRTGFIALVARR